MQFTTIATLFAVTIASVAAIPGRSGGSRPDRPAPVLIYNTVSSLSPHLLTTEVQPEDKQQAYGNTEQLLRRYRLLLLS